MAAQLLEQADIDTRLAAADAGWSGSTAKLTRSIEFADFPTAVEFVVRIAPRCEERNHHPDLGIHWRRVDVELSSHDAGGVTALDFDLLAIVDDVVAGLPLV